LYLNDNNLKTMFWLQDPISDADESNKKSEIKNNVANHQVVHAIAKKANN